MSDEENLEGSLIPTLVTHPRTTRHVISDTHHSSPITHHAPRLPLLKHRLPKDMLQVQAIAVLGERLGQFRKLRGIDPSLPIGDFFRARHFESLPALNGRDKLAGVKQRFMGARIEPGVPPGP